MVSNIVQLLLIGFVSLIVAQDWKHGRSTWFEVERGNLTTANCHKKWDEINTGRYVGAFADTNPVFASSCGICVEVLCESSSFTDGNGEWLDRPSSSTCKDTATSVYVTIADACPCHYPNNQFSNSRWCCGDQQPSGKPYREHIDITKEAYDKIAHLHMGVMGIKYRIVDCSSVPASLSSYYPELKDGAKHSDNSSPSNSGPSAADSNWSSQQQPSEDQFNKASNDMKSKMSGLLGKFGQWFKN